MKTRLVWLLALFLLPAMMFAGELSFYGWSKGGKLALLQGSAGEWSFLIVDTVTDETAARIGPEAGGRDDFLSRNDGKIKSLLNTHGIVVSTPQVITGTLFETGGVTYTVRTVEEKGSVPDDTGRIPYLSLEVIIDTSREDSKTVHRYKNDGKGLPLSGFAIKGILLSPYEKRAAIVCREELAGRDGTVETYRIIGAHLTVGYERSVRPGSGLLSAVLNGQFYVTKMFLDKGADPDTKDKRGFPALLLACRNGKWEIALLLVTRGATVNCSDDKGRTPLHYAADAGRIELCRVLVERGASRTTADKGGKLPRDLASARGYKSVADIVSP